MNVLEVSHLRKSFGTIKAVKDISFSVQKGEIFTIIGPNGAGKTTTLEMVEGLLPPDEGRIFFGEWTWERNASLIKEMIGVQPQTEAMFELLTPEEHLELFSTFYSKSKPVKDILHLINLYDQRKQKIKKLSGGQRQRLAIGLAIISDPEIIFLDEPTTGLDPQARRNIWNIILELKSLGKTTILTTHYMEEAEKLSDRVCIVDQGEVIAMDAPGALIEMLTKEREIHISFHEGNTAIEETENFLKQIDSIAKLERFGSSISIWTSHPENTLFELFSFTKEKQYKFKQVSIREMSLEDVFLTFTGKEWRD